MKQLLKARLEQLGRTEGTGHTRSGSPVDLVLRPVAKHLNSIEAISLLTAAGLSLLRAKRVVEYAMEHGQAYVTVPTVPAIDVLIAALTAAGFNAASLARAPVDVKAVRERLDLSQEQFALQFNLDLDTVRNWEQGRHTPDRASASYLRVIARLPREAAAAQEEMIE